MRNSSRAKKQASLRLGYQGRFQILHILHIFVQASFNILSHSSPEIFRKMKTVQNDLLYAFYKKRMKIWLQCLYTMNRQLNLNQTHLINIKTADEHLL